MQLDSETLARLLEPTPLYKDWGFWAVLVAILALVLSQLPPVHLLLKRTKLDRELHSRIAWTHAVGNPNANVHIIFDNVGGRSVRIKNVELSFRRNGEEIFTLPVQSYRPTDASGDVLFTPFTLDPEDDWGNIYLFYKH